MLIPGKAAARGFTLVEMMIAIVLGMILIGSTLALVVSTGQANAEAVQSARLTQEMRAISEIVSRELRRARFIDDSIGLIGTGGATTNPYDAMVVSNAGACIQYSYQNVSDMGTPTDETDDVTVDSFRTLWRADVDGRGVVFLATDDAASPACGADAAAALSSPQVNVTSLVFVANDACTPTAVQVTMQAQLVGDADIARTFVDDVRLRNAALPGFTCASP